MLFKDKTTFTSDPLSFPANGAKFNDLWIGVTGAGPAYIDLLDAEDGTWRTYPELTFSGTTGQLLTLPRGTFRVRVAAASATTVKLQW